MPFGLPLRSDWSSEKLNASVKVALQSEHDQRLAQIFAPAALRVQGRIGDSQYLGRERRIHAQRLGDLPHLDVRIARQLDDMRGDTRRTGEIDYRTKVCLDVGIHAPRSNQETETKVLIDC